MTRFEMYPSASGFRPLLPGTVVSRTAPGCAVAVVDSKAGKTYAEGRTVASRTASESTAVFVLNVQPDRLYGAFLMAQGEISVAVLGAGGTIAPAIVADLAQSEEVTGMTLLDLDPARAQAVADAHGGGKASAAEIDARSVDDLAAAIGDAGVLVNTASYRINLEAMRACLQAGCNYLDLGGLYWMTGRQRELGADFERAGLLAVLGIGSSPGKTNLMAARGVRELGSADYETIDVMAAGRDPAAPDDGRMRPPYAIQTLLDELTLAPVVLRDGQPVEIDPLSPGGSVNYGDPIGTAET